jgi:TrmH family RNA methyltransferase
MLKPGEFEALSFAENFHIVLVQPQHSLNIGSAARAMMNLGFKNLVLVKPENFDLKKASVTARWAAPLVENAVFPESLKEALGSFNEVVGFGGRYDQNKYENVSLPEWIKTVDKNSKQKTALVFGPEDRGLSTSESDHCRYLVRIPSTEAYPSFNLAQAVLLVLYELSRLEWQESLPGREERELPERNDFHQMERMLDEILVETGFYREGTPDPVPGVIKRLFQRMNPDQREMRILLAMIGRIARRLGK